MKRILQSLVVLLLLGVSTISCTEELNFNQYNEFEATPTYEASLLYLEAEEGLLNLISDTNIFSQDFNFDAFSSEVFADRVLDGTLTYVLENTTSKEIEITVELLDQNDIITDKEVFLASPSMIIEREVFYGDSGESIDIIKTLSSIRVTARNLGDNTSVSNLPDPLVTLKSSGKFRLRLK